MAKREFAPKAAAVAASRIEDEAAAMFGAVAPTASAAPRNRRPQERSHRVTFEVGDDLYYAMHRHVKRVGSPYRNVSQMIRALVEREVEGGGDHEG